MIHITEPFLGLDYPYDHHQHTVFRNVDSWLCWFGKFCRDLPQGVAAELI
ncbi:hypothetical protein AB395_00003458 [Sinorhizobium fredii CCBAU 45436]|nr:hypothetical protein AB395_00003458 [Sinorhizobium fredii CCBAU 45436]